MQLSSKIFVAGHRGLVGSSIVRHLQSLGYTNVITKSRAELDLTNQSAVDAFFSIERPEYVFLAAAKVGGILANSSYPAEFLRDNLAIQNNVIHSSWRNGVRKLEFLGSSCIYPKLAPQPIKEEYLLTGALEPTNEWYAIAKIAGIKTCQAYRAQYGFNAISLMPTNLYGPGDNFDLTNSHVLPALIRKFHEAKIAGLNESDSDLSSTPLSPPSQVTIWGSGSPRREFLHVDDLASASVHLMLHYDNGEIVNVGTGEDITISELALMVKDVTGFEGELVFDRSKPDGTPRKLLDISRLKDLGWKASIPLGEGIRSTYAWFLQHLEQAVLAHT